jgi:hypothetical protein
MTEPNGPVVQICHPDHVAVLSRVVGLAVVDDDGNHLPDCGGCQGRGDDETCRYTIKQREGLKRLGFSS